MKLDAKAFIRANKNKTRVDDFPIIKKVKNLLPVNEMLITRDEANQRIRIASTATSYVDKATGEVKAIEKNLIDTKNLVSTLNNTFKIQIAKDLNSQNGILFQDGKHSIIMYPVLKDEGVKGEINVKHSNKIVFKNFVEQDTLEYLVQENGLKENIIIPCMRDSYVYNFKLQLCNLRVQITGNQIHFLDEETNVRVFSMGNLFMFDRTGERSKSIQLTLDELTAYDYDLTITANSKWINSSNRNFPVTIDPQIQIADEPVLTLKEHVKGNYTPAINNKMVLGIKDGNLHQIFLTINAEAIVSELAKSNIHKFKAYVELHYEQGKRIIESRGFTTYQGSTLIQTNLLKNEEKTLLLDITKLVEDELSRYKSGRTIADIHLQLSYFKTYIGSASDEQNLDIKINDDYVYLMDKYYDNLNLRPDIQLEYIKEDEVVEGTPFLEYETGKAGKTSLNIYNGNISHSIGLGSIEANALKIDIGLLYDTRLKNQENNSETLPFGAGWMLNVHQRLEKREDYNKLLGSKDITYYDGNNNPHTLREKWYYEENEVRHYIPKDLVYIDNDQKMKYKDGSSRVYNVEYEVSNDEGLSLVTTNSKMNYRTTSDKKCIRKYFIEISNQKIEVTMKNGYLRVPHYFKSTKDWVNASYVPTFLEYLKNDISFSLKNLNVREYISLDKVKNSGYSYYNASNDKLSSDYMNCQIYYKDGMYYVKGLRKKYYVSSTNGRNSKYFEDSIHDTYDIPLIVEKTYQINKSNPLPDYYENEDIAKINSQIQQVKDYVDDLKFQTKSASNAVQRLEIEISTQKLNLEKMTSMNYMRDQATGKNNEIYPPQIYDYDSEGKKFEDTEKTKKNKEYRELLKKQTKISDDYQIDNLKYQISSLESQLEEQQVSLDKSYEKLSEYELQLANLKEQKEALVAEQKKGVQDYIIDKSGNILGFNYYGKLVFITDSYENEVNIVYDDNKITEIVSKTQRMYFNYNKDNYVSSVVDAQGRRKEFIYEKNILAKMIFIAENNQKQEIKFQYALGNLSRVIDPSGLYLSVNKESNGIHIVQGTKTESISTKEIKELKTAKTLVDIAVEGIQTASDSVRVLDYLNRVNTTHHFDVSGRLIHSFEEDLDTDKFTSTFIHFEDKNKQFEVAFKENKKIKSFYLGREINKRFTAVLNLTTNEAVSKSNTTLNPEKISTCKFAFARLDLRNLSQRKWLSLNQITLKAVVVDKNNKKRSYSSFYNNLTPQVIGIPFALNSTDKKVSVSIIARKSIDLETIRFMDFFEAEGTYATYNSDHQIIQTEDGATTTLYEGFVDDKPTRMIAIDEFGDRRISYVSYDSKGRVVFEEDYLRNCKETFYDEKGNIIETREYNKECPTLAKVSKTEYDEQGNATGIDGVMRDENGDYPQQKISYLPNSSKVISTKSASGQVMCYGYDYNTDDLLEIASDAKGQGNSTRMKYRFGLLTSLTHHGFTIDYTLDGQGRKTGITVAGKTLLTTEYTDQYTDEDAEIYRGSKVTTKTLDGFESTTIKDKEGKLVSTITTENDFISYMYDTDDQLVEVQNTATGELAHTDYNTKGLVVKNKTVTDKLIVESVNTYNDKDLVVSMTTTFGDKSSTSEFKYDKVYGDRIYETLVDGDLKQSLEYDALNRITKRTLSSQDRVLLEDEYEYLQYGENSLDLIKEHNVRIGGKLLDTVSYTYDVSGNITNVLRDEFKTRYAYDKLNRLVREDNPRLNQTIVYKYDNGGNILLKKIYPYTLEQEVFGGEMCHYTYSSSDWKDQLVDFNGQAITYDEMGRPVQIGDTPLSWNKKGQLTSFGDSKYTYNLNGIRTSKTVNGIKTDYYLSGNKILREMSNEKDIIYHYAMEKIVGFLYNNVEYIYERNVQGDILCIYKKDDLTRVAEYLYDAYGNHQIINYTKDNIGDINPIRYRGYYFDTETKLYYLNSRYYNPAFGRFISPDTLSILDETKAQINGLNLYMYCGDNPVMNVDPSGMAWWSWLVAGLSLVAGAALCFVPGGQALGVSLLVAGGSMMASNIMEACGVDGKVASIISSGLDILAGIALCFTPFASIGASMIGSGIGGLAGGFISEACGGSFEMGSVIGSIVGGILGSGAYKLYDSHKVAQIAKQGSVVIGETMSRVTDTAGKLGVGHFKASKFANFLYKLNNKLGATLTMSENISWIRRVAKAGVDVVNIGLDLGRTTRSPYYIMELQKVFQLILFS